MGMAMNRYTKEQWQDCLAVIRQTLEQADAALADRTREQVSSDVRTWHSALYGEQPQKDGVERWKCEANEQEENFARERAARARNMQLARASIAAIYEQRIVKVEAQLLSVIRAMSTVTEKVEAELRDLQQEGAETATRRAQLEARLAEAIFRIDQLYETVAADCRCILDLLPSVPAACEGPDDDERQIGAPG